MEKPSQPNPDEIREQELLVEARALRETIREATEAENRLMAHGSLEPAIPNHSPVEQLKEVQVETPMTGEEFWGGMGLREPGAINTETRSEDEKIEVEIKKELKELPKEDRITLLDGLNKVGFVAENLKSEAFAFAFDWVSKKVENKGTIARFTRGLRDSFRADAEMARKKMDSGKNAPALTMISNVAYLTKNIVRPLRLLMDMTGMTPAGVQRIIMSGGMIAGRTIGAMKEARFANEKLIEKTRIGRNFTKKDEELTEQDKRDAEEAEKEAWKIYEATRKKAGDKIDAQGNIPAEELKTAYLREIPKDLQERLKNTSVANEATKGLFRKHLEFDVNRLNKDIKNIEDNKKLTPEKREAKREQLLRRWEKRLTDYDRVLTQTGTVDAWAMVGRYGEATAKNVVRYATLETLYLAWENFAHVDSEQYTETITQTQKIETPAPVIPSPTPVTSPVPETPSLVHTEAPKIPTPNISHQVNPEFDVVQKKEGIETVLRRQIENNPELAKTLGFKGDVTDTKALHEFSGGAAHKVALYKGYVDRVTGEEIRVRSAGEVAYKLTLSGNDADPFKVEEFQKVDGSFVSQESHGNEPKFEGDSKEEYEYRDSKQEKVTQVEPKADVNTKTLETPVAEVEKNNIVEPTPIEIPEEEEPEDTIDSKQAETLKNMGFTGDPNNPEEVAKFFEAQAGISGEHGEALAENLKTNPEDAFFNTHEVEQPEDKVAQLRKTLLERMEELKNESPAVNTTIENPPEPLNNFLGFTSKIAGNPLNLPDGVLEAVDETYTRNINKFFTDTTDWESVRKMRAHSMLEFKGFDVEGSKGVASARSYLSKLVEITKIKPKNSWFFGRENVEHYVARALQYASTKIGMLERIKLSK